MANELGFEEELDSPLKQRNPTRTVNLIGLAMLH